MAIAEFDPPGYSQQGGDVLKLSQVGSRSVCLAFWKQFGGALPRRKAGVWQYSTSGWRAADALSWMYESEGPYLLRKKDLFKQEVACARPV